MKTYHYVPEFLDYLQKLIPNIKPEAKKSKDYLQKYYDALKQSRAFWIQPEAFPLILYTDLSEESLLESVKLPAPLMAIEYTYDYTVRPYSEEKNKEKTDRRITFLAEQTYKIVVSSAFYSESSKSWVLAPVILSFDKDYFFKPWEWTKTKQEKGQMALGFLIPDQSDPDAKISLGSYVSLSNYNPELLEDLIRDAFYEAHFALRFLAVLSCEGVKCGEVKPDPKKNNLRRHLKKPSIPSYSYIYLSKKDKVEKSLSGFSGDKKAAHWRRGHVRNQPHGPKNSLRKRIWVAPQIVGTGVIQPLRPIQVKM